MANIDRPIVALPASESDAAVALSAEAAWNQLAPDWKLMLTRGRGFGVRDDGGRGWLGSALMLPIDGRVAWISMVLVTKRARRRGYGTALLQRCFDEAHNAGVLAGLDATELGRPVYLQQGFRDVYSLRRFRLPRAMPTPSAAIAMRALNADDLPRVVAFDAARSGVERRWLLEHLAARCPHVAFVAEQDGALTGFILARDGRIATQLGPVVAMNDTTALALIAAATSRHEPPFFLDVPNLHTSFITALRAAGAEDPRGFMRMTRGDPGRLASATHIFAISGPEFG
jgi:GNAT superfamily N-acetyltransferase